MTAYRVLVAHRDLKLKSVVHLEDTEQVRFLVEAGYLKPFDTPAEVAGTAPVFVTVDETPVLPRKGRPRRKPEVIEDVEGEAGSDGGSEVRVP